MTYRRSALHVHKARPAGSERKPWVQLVEAGRLLARRARGTSFNTGLCPMEEAVGDFKALMRDVKAAEFPSKEASAVKLAEAFLSIGTAFVVGVTRREDIAPALEATAEAIDRILSELRADAARSSWAGYMERD